MSPRYRCFDMARRLGSLFRGRKRKQRRTVELIRTSGLFDVEWYVRTYTESRGVGTDPILYWLETGWQLGHDPHPDFSVSRYLDDNADVASAGINPLLHFIEFGRAEGRHAAAPEPVWIKPDSVSFEFAEPAPVFRGTIPDLPEIPRHDRNSSTGEPVNLRDQIVGAARDAQIRRLLETAVGQLCALSGDPTEAVGPYAASGGECRTLIDAWYANSGRLRTRWSGSDQAAIMRAYQVDPLDCMAVKLIGEALVVTALDTADLSLANPLFPILFVWLDPAGSVQGWSFLVFPSLCRDGLHYSETMASEWDVTTNSGRRAAELVALLQHPSSAWVEVIAVDLRRGDGSGPLFQRYCRLWLEKVMRVGVRAGSDCSLDPVTRFLAEEVMVTGSRQGDQSRVLHIGADMVPTIGVLTMVRSEGRDDDVLHRLPLVCSMANSSSADILMKPPPASIAPSHRFLRDVAPWDWPSLHGAPVEVGRDECAAAIRYVRRPPIGDNQWLVPYADSALPFAERASVTWLMEPSKWIPERIKESFQVLSAQLNASSIQIGLIGPVHPSLHSFAEKLFPKRVRRFSSLVDGAAAVSTTMAGFLGRNVVLHDRRATFFLSWIAEDEQITTASCVVLNHEKIGRQWRSTPGDGGDLHTAGASKNAYKRAIEALWRCTYQVASPPTDLWLGRAGDVIDWLRIGSPAGEYRRHWCTALITAARVEPERTGGAKRDLSRFPNADRATSYDALV